jgi:hypothetical protein
MTNGEAPNGADMRAVLPKPRPSVIHQELPDGAILYCAEQELYFGLNRTGACIWENLNPVCSTMDELCAVLARRFAKVDADGARSDAGRLLARLAEHELVIEDR